MKSVLNLLKNYVELTISPELTICPELPKIADGRYLTKSIFRLLRTYPEILPSAILGNSGQMVNSGLMVNST